MFDIEKVPLFSGLRDSFLTALNEKILVKKYQEGSIVFYEGDSSQYLHILLEGTVKIFKTTHKGSHVQINRFIAPSLIAEFACFEQIPFPASCEFMTDGTIGLLPFDVLYEYLQNPQFSLELIKSLSQKIALLSSHIHKEAILSSEAKVADLILRKAHNFSEFKHNEIAAILNVTPETFSRILTKLKKEGIIEIENQQLKILNQKALYSIIENNTLKEHHI
jgi:CRP/FNR family transcriptional regulator